MGSGFRLRPFWSKNRSYRGYLEMRGFTFAKENPAHRTKVLDERSVRIALVQSQESSGRLAFERLGVKTPERRKKMEMKTA